jgi:hypothetical protein
VLSWQGSVYNMRLLFCCCCCWQVLYDTQLMTQATLVRFFPASAVPDVTRHRCWASYR